MQKIDSFGENMISEKLKKLLNSCFFNQAIILKNKNLLKYYKD